MLYDVIIIGAGPAGISASLYARRANLNVLVLHNGAQALEKAEKIENYYGFPEGISGRELYEAGLAQAKNLGVEIKKALVTNLGQNSDKSFFVTVLPSGDKDNAGSDGAGQGKETDINSSALTFNSKTLILATGNKKLRPSVKGITEYEGHGISYCAVCDAFFYRQKDVAVIGNGIFALTEAEDLVNAAKSVKILTDGQSDEIIKNTAGGKYEIITSKIKEIKGSETSGRLSHVVFEDGRELAVDGLFIALGQAGASDFAKKTGIFMEGDSIKTDEKMRTNIKGLFSAGNCNGGLLQISKAVYEGARAALSAISYLRERGDAE